MARGRPPRCRRIWRVEDAQGRGPWHRDVQLSVWRMPRPQRDEFASVYQTPRTVADADQEFGPISPRHRFGFERKGHARKWWTPGQLAILEKYGFHLRPVLVRGYRRGKVQIVFKQGDRC